MKFILLVMFFITPPAQKGHEVWALQNTTTMEFDNFKGCDEAVNKIIKSIKTTDTVSLFGWCLPAAGAGATADVQSIGKDYQWVPR